MAYRSPVVKLTNTGTRGPGLGGLLLMFYLTCVKPKTQSLYSVSSEPGSFKHRAKAGLNIVVKSCLHDMAAVYQ